MVRLASALILTLVAAQAAQAQTTVDVAKVTCEQFLLSRDLFSFSIWLNGFYHGQRNDPLVAIERAKGNAKKLRSACAAPKNANIPVMQVIEAAKVQ